MARARSLPSTVAQPLRLRSLANDQGDLGGAPTQTTVDQQGRHRVARAPRPPGESATVLMSATRRQGKRCPTTDCSLPPPRVPSRTASPSPMSATSARAPGMPRNEQPTGTTVSSCWLRLSTSGGANFVWAELSGTGDRGVARETPGAPRRQRYTSRRIYGRRVARWHRKQMVAAHARST